MSISRWDPWGDMVSLREAMNSLLEESFVRGRGPARPGTTSLAIDVRETPEAFVVTASVPGVRPEEVEITVLGETIRIAGRRQDETEEQDAEGRWLVRERHVGAFERSVSLPAAVRADAAAADFKSGVLTITLPKAEEAKPRTIAVRSGTDNGAANSIA
ncbi:MAG: Hsp20/alpha crystallin family protein [Thermomicrobiales bacterium]